MQQESLLLNIHQRQKTLAENLSGELHAIEQLRLQFLKKRRKTNLWFFLTAIPIIVSSIIFVPHLSVFLFIIAIVIYGILTHSKHRKKIERFFAKKIIPQIQQEFFPEATFYEDSHISEDDYENSGLFPQKLDRYYGNNYFQGTFGKTDVRFSKLHTEYKTESNDKTHWTTVFEGIFMVADCNKKFNGQTYISPDIGERYFGRLGRLMHEKNPFSIGKMVYLENPNFEKKFVVYSTDPVEARYLLTPSMQHYLLDLYHHNNSDLYLSFVDGNVYIGLSGSFNMFDLNTKLSFLDKNTLKLYSKDLIHILKAIEILDLNTRIWGS